MTTINIGRKHLLRDATEHTKTLRKIDALFSECSALALHTQTDYDGIGEVPLHWRLREARTKLRDIIDSLERGYLVEKPNENPKDI